MPRPFSNFCHESSVPHGTSTPGPVILQNVSPLSLLFLSLRADHTLSLSLSVVSLSTVSSAYVCAEDPWDASPRKFADASRITVALNFYVRFGYFSFFFSILRYKSDRN